ncbi:hypothetical protein, partial [Kingella kingae]|uniref:hypothetical protein n=1 Tax=Kingella kingae TaxID=504 RepID=UPI001E528183
MIVKKTIVCCALPFIRGGIGYRPCPKHLQRVWSIIMRRFGKVAQLFNQRFFASGATKSSRLPCAAESGSTPQQFIRIGFNPRAGPDY